MDEYAINTCLRQWLEQQGADLSKLVEKKKFSANHEKNCQVEKTSRTFKGHHPDCDMFKDRIIIIKNKKPKKNQKKITAPAFLGI
jgi:hypothetical protein